MNIAVIGSGYVGLTTGTCFAEMGNKVVCVDKVKEKISMLNRLEVPIFEPGLEELVKKNFKAGRLFFSTDLENAVKGAEIVFIAVGTPPRPNGEADLSFVEEVARQIAKAIDKYTVVVEKSTVPVETGEKVAATIEQSGARRELFDVVSNPEFLREGSAIKDFMEPDRIVIGTNSEKARKVMQKLYAPLKSEIVFTDIRSAEIIKHASNSFLATKISFINAVANVCELAGADIEQVALGMGLDKRIGRQFLKAGIGYGGSCLDGAEYIMAGNPSLNLSSFENSFENNYSSQSIVALGFNGEASTVIPVRAMSKRLFKGEMITFRTSMGKRIRVTADHPMAVVENGSLTTKLASEINEGDSLPVLLSLPEKPLNEIDLVERLEGIDFRTRIKVRLKDKKLSDFKKKLWPVFRKHFSSGETGDFFRHNCFPFEMIKEIEKSGVLFNHEGLLLFTSKGNTTYCPAKIFLSEDFWRLVGYYLSEGCIHYERGLRGIRARVQFHFNLKEKEYIEDVCGILESLNIKYSLSKREKNHTLSIIISSKIFAFFLDNVLGLGKGSYDARIPSEAFFSSKKGKINLIKGIFRGDAYPYFHKNAESITIEFGTASPELSQGVIVLLQSFGIVPSYKQQLMKKSKVPAHILRVSGINQVKKLCFFDSNTNTKILSKIAKSKKSISQMGFKKYNGFAAVKIKQIKKEKSAEMVYSMEVGKPHLFATSHGLIVHNCFPKDVDAFIKISAKNGYDFKLLKEVQEINKEQRKRFVKKVEGALWNVKDKKIAVFGLAFKPNTDDMREAPSLDIISALQKEGAKITAFDPVAEKNAAKLLPGISFNDNVYETARGADALLVLTEWSEFKKIDLKKLKKAMSVPLVIDGRNVFDPKEMNANGFTYICVGRK